MGAGGAGSVENHASKTFLRQGGACSQMGTTAPPGKKFAQCNMHRLDLRMRVMPKDSGSTGVIT